MRRSTLPSVFIAAFASVPLVTHAAATRDWHAARQLIAVQVDGWNADHGSLRRFQRDGNAWRAVGAAIPVTIGTQGAAWGTGLNADHPTAGPAKREGDNRSPAGVFGIGEVFGYAARGDTAMRYRPLAATDWCVDVVGSPHYNRIVDARVVGEAAVKGSSEPMRRDLHLHGDQRYAQGFVIENNPDAVPGKGSCIFAHLWKSPTDATAGCTAMTPVAMKQLLAWLKPDDDPVFVLLPHAQYAALQREWGLPAWPAEGAVR